jgi:DNA-directed RNA polymerase subunit beta'
MKKEKKVFYNCVIDKKQLKEIMAWAFTDFGSMKAAYLANKIKDIGFEYSTKAGLSISIEDLKVPPIKKQIIKSANKKIIVAQREVDKGEITEVERFQKVIKTWSNTSETLKEQVINYFCKTDPLNSIYIMAFSGARGNISQVKQLVGMRGLMADPTGQIIDLPILNNFREGLTITDYIISSYGARKGLVDTALRTADSGYLTRRLIDVAQDIITREKNCNTKNGIVLTQVVEGSKIIFSLKERIIGRVLAIPLKNPKTGALIANRNEEISSFLAKNIIDLNIKKILVRSPLTCSSSRSICQQCYGWNLAYGSLIDLGEAVGILAAQSIGEPGTQLTMRTFHTGGVFNTEYSRQIKAQYSGQIIFSKTLKTQLYRTPFGEMACIAENESYLNLITYDNENIILEISPKTFIFVKNKDFVKKNEIIFEIASKTIKTDGETTSKYIYASQSGEIFLENHKDQTPYYKSKLNNKNTCLLWILFGEVYDVPLKSKIQITPNSYVDKNNILSESKLITFRPGFIKFSSKNNTKNKEELSILWNSKSLRNLNIYVENNINNNKNCTIYGSQNRRIIIKSLITFANKNFSTLANLLNISYRTKTGGTFYSTSFNDQTKQKTRIQKVGGTIFYIPEATYKINKTIKSLSIKHGGYIKVNQEIFKNQFTNISGITYIIRQRRSIKEIIIKPGDLILVHKNKLLKQYHQKLMYSGEILLDNIKINRLSFTEIVKIKGQTFLAIYPVIRYEILNTKNELQFFPENCFSKNQDIKIQPLKARFKNSKVIKNYLPFQIVQHKILSDSTLLEKNCILEFNIVKQNEPIEKLKVSLLYSKNISINKLLPAEFKKDEILFTKLIQNKQFIEPYTNLISFQIPILEKEKIINIKQQFINNQRKILLNSSENYKKIYIEQSNLAYRQNTLEKMIAKDKNNLILSNSGFITKIYGDHLILHKGNPYLFSEGAIVEKRPGNFIKQGEKLGQLLYERARTEDIVQGLPKVDEILEARKPKIEACLATRPGFVIDIKSYPSEVHMWVIPNNSNTSQQDFYKIANSERLLVGRYEFITVGQTLNDGPINLHAILEIYFSYYRSIQLFPIYNSAYRSFRKVQSILLNSIQAVYYSQGVFISDKHIEIIIKQMTGKVEIITSGDSPLLPDELVELKQVNYINKCLKQKEPALFRPIILGITKASLKTNSFISAASFQHTTKILTEAAIRGKTDWLRGLKENVIVGRLIPAGTGFNIYNDISQLEVKIPSFLGTKKDNSSSESPKRETKYRKLKNKIKFREI